MPYIWEFLLKPFEVLPCNPSMSFPSDPHHFHAALLRPLIAHLKRRWRRRRRPRSQSSSTVCVCCVHRISIRYAIHAAFYIASTHGHASECTWLRSPLHDTITTAAVATTASVHLFSPPRVFVPWTHKCLRCAHSSVPSWFSPDPHLKRIPMLLCCVRAWVRGHWSRALSFHPAETRMQLAMHTHSWMSAAWMNNTRHNACMCETVVVCDNKSNVPACARAGKTLLSSAAANRATLDTDTYTNTNTRTTQ